MRFVLISKNVMHCSPETDVNKVSRSTGINAHVIRNRIVLEDVRTVEAEGDEECPATAATATAVPDSNP